MAVGERRNGQRHVQSGRVESRPLIGHGDSEPVRRLPADLTGHLPGRVPPITVLNSVVQQLPSHQGDLEGIDHPQACQIPSQGLHRPIHQPEVRRDLDSQVPGFSFINIEHEWVPFSFPRRIGGYPEARQEKIILENKPAIGHHRRAHRIHLFVE